MPDSRPPEITGTYVRFDDMLWPNPEDPTELGWRLTYGGTPTRADTLAAVSYISSYGYLFEIAQKERNARITRIKQILTDHHKEQPC